MLLRFKVPADIFLVGPTKESLDVSARFQLTNLSCRLSLPGEPTQVTDQDDFYKSSRYIEIVVEGVDNPIEKLVSTQNYNELGLQLSKIANRFLRGIRNFGTVAHLHETKDIGFSPENNVKNWNVEIKRSETEWETLMLVQIEWSRMWSLKLLPRVTSKIAIIYVKYWPEIQQAILEDRDPPPEREFTTNSIEYLDNKNYRLAVVESIIGLEIVLSRFLTEYMIVYKNLSKERISEFLSPEFGLTSRLAGILHLTMSPNDMINIDLNKVRRAVKWRNRIIHKTGHLPSGLDVTEVEDCVAHVISLSLLLGFRADRINTLPEPMAFSSFRLNLENKDSKKIVIP